MLVADVPDLQGAQDVPELLRRIPVADVMDLPVEILEEPEAGEERPLHVGRSRQDKGASRLENPRQLLHDPVALHHVLDDLAQHDEVESPVGKWEVPGVAMEETGPEGAGRLFHLIALEVETHGSGEARDEPVVELAPAAPEVEDPARGREALDPWLKNLFPLHDHLAHHRVQRQIQVEKLREPGTHRFPGKGGGVGKGFSSVARCPSVPEISPAPVLARAVTAVRFLGIGRILREGLHLAGRSIKRLFPGGILVPLPLLHLRGRRMLLDLGEPMLSLFMVVGLHGQETAWLLRRLLHPGMTFVDGGAHFGYFTLLGASLVGETGRVVAVEADPRNGAVLRANLALNRLRNVEVVVAALADRRRTLHLQKASESAWHGLYAVRGPVQSIVEVPGVPLDDLLSRADVIKFDLQGAEPIVLRGMERLLRQPGLNIIMEFWPEGLERAGVPPQRFLDELRSRFEVFVVRGPGLERCPASITLQKGEVSVDLFLVQPSSPAPPPV